MLIFFLVHSKHSYIFVLSIINQKSKNEKFTITKQKQNKKS